MYTINCLPHRNTFQYFIQVYTTNISLLIVLYFYFVSVRTRLPYQMGCPFPFSSFWYNILPIVYFDTFVCISNDLSKLGNLKTGSYTSTSFNAKIACFTSSNNFHSLGPLFFNFINSSFFCRFVSGLAIFVKFIMISYFLLGFDMREARDKQLWTLCSRVREIMLVHTSRDMSASGQWIVNKKSLLWKSFVWRKHKLCTSKNFMHLISHLLKQAVFMNHLLVHK